MNEMFLEAALTCLSHTIGDMCDKHFERKEELSECEQTLLNDLHTLVIHSQYKEIIRQHFSIKQK